MRHQIFQVAVAATIFVAAPGASAQVCTGGQNLARRITVLGIGGSANKDSRLMVGTLTAGTGSAYGSVSVGRQTFDGVHDIAYPAFATIGLGADVPETTVEICPLVSGSYVKMRNLDGSGDDITRSSFSPGVAVGYTTPLTETALVTPSVEVALVTDKFTVSNGIETLGDSESSGVLTLALGFALGERVMVTPRAAIPFATRDGAQNSYGVALSFGFGSRQ